MGQSVHAYANLKFKFKLHSKVVEGARSMYYLLQAQDADSLSRDYTC